jgi:hypothetical protein
MIYFKLTIKPCQNEMIAKKARELITCFYSFFVHLALTKAVLGNIHDLWHRFRITHFKIFFSDH